MIDIKHFKLAYELNNRYRASLNENEAHFRGSANSVSLISLDNSHPELGVRCNYNELRRAKDISRELSVLKLRRSELSGRDTPEKRLQSWIISSAIKNNGILPFGDNIHFITSELALTTGSKVVTDILGFRPSTKQLYIIELKSSRLLKKLLDQLDSFERAIIQFPDFLQELLSIHGFEPYADIMKDVRKLVVWPKGNGLPKQELKVLEIEEVTYAQDKSLHKAYSFSSNTI